MRPRRRRRRCRSGPPSSRCSSHPARTAPGRPQASARVQSAPRCAYGPSSVDPSRRPDLGMARTAQTPAPCRPPCRPCGWRACPAATRSRTQHPWRSRMAGAREQPPCCRPPRRQRNRLRLRSLSARALPRRRRHHQAPAPGPLRRRCEASTARARRRRRTSSLPVAYTPSPPQAPRWRRRASAPPTRAPTRPSRRAARPGSCAAAAAAGRTAPPTRAATPPAAPPHCAGSPRKRGTGSCP
mmetsp:Transcript_4825/g.14665  ORF Transcript_4825/g.14665 Transcript_4825/m.14665 type:complete len:241 (-) Transcript_4825:497-1219(-)